MAGSVGEALINLISLLRKDFSPIKGLKSDVEDLVHELFAFEAIIQDAEVLAIEDVLVANWLRNLKHAAYDANNELDLLSLKIQSSTDKVSRSFSSILNPLKKFMFRRRIAQKIKEIKIIFEEIYLFRFHLNTVNTVLPGEFINRETTSMITVPRIYGRNDNKIEIIRFLVNDFVNQENVSIFPICGMAGIGKTSLAQLIYNEDIVQRHFNVKIWVSVSYAFDTKRILKSTVESFNRIDCNLEGLESLGKMVTEILRDNRYLVVMDDVWSESQGQWWDLLKIFFNVGAKGSSILLTTRSLTVASIVGTVPAYPLGALSDDDCFSLLMNYALVGDWGEEEHPNLVRIGMEIALKCKGIPLAAKNLGSLLRRETDERLCQADERLWQSIKDSEIWSLEHGDNSIFASLRLSYNHLPPRLKQCFSYCSIFPKNFKIQKTKLIYQWIANGFIQSDGNMELEDVGDGIFNELLQKFFFQDLIQGNFGNVVSCKMHDFMHDLAYSVATDECCIAKVSQEEHVPKTIRYLSVVCDSPESITDVDHLLSSQPSLYTLLFFNPFDFSGLQFSSTLRVLNLSEMGIHIFPDLVCDLKHLRYLDLSGNLLKILPESIHQLSNLQMLDLGNNSEITTLPDSICTLVHMRYLDLSEMQIDIFPNSFCELKLLRHLDLSGNLLRSLPESIHQLTNLKTLDVRKNFDITALPISICKLENLRYLGFSECCKLPVGIGRLRYLTTLAEFVVGTSSDGNSEGGLDISELQELDSLRGGLKIKGLENVRNVEHAKEANLKRKLYLTHLELIWESDDPLQVNNNKEVLEGLELPPNVEELEITNYQWETTFSEGFLRNLNCLRSVEINSGRKLRSLPRELENLKALTSLTILGCHELVSLPEGLLQKLVSMERLKIWSCNNLKSLGGMRIQEGLVSNNPSSSSSSLPTSLQKLEICYCPELVLSNEDFQHFIALRDLCLDSLPKLTALPQGLQHLRMLQNIEIFRCSNMSTLPEWMDLMNLQSLEIIHCHEELLEKCDRENGEYWRFISNIPHVTIR